MASSFLLFFSYILSRGGRLCQFKKLFFATVKHKKLLSALMRRVLSARERLGYKKIFVWVVEY